MTEHDIQELERQLDAARSRKNAAADAYAKAGDRLVEAKIQKAEAEMEARGIKRGMRVRARRQDREVGWRSEVGIYDGFGRAHFGTDAKIVVRKITKTGKAHASQCVNVYIHDAIWEVVE